jgi:hypothetical protein
MDRPLLTTQPCFKRKINSSGKQVLLPMEAAYRTPDFTPTLIKLND